MTCPPSLPTLKSSLYPVRFSRLAASRAATISPPSIARSLSSTSFTDAICRLGTTSKCTRAFGLMSLKITTSSVSETISAGRRFSAMSQKRHPSIRLAILHFFLQMVKYLFLIDRFLRPRPHIPHDHGAVERFFLPDDQCIGRTHFVGEFQLRAKIVLGKRLRNGKARFAQLLEQHQAFAF